MKLNKIAQAIRDCNFFVVGQCLAMDDIATAQYWKDAIVHCKNPRDRSSLKSGYVDTQVSVAGLSEVYAVRKFYALCRLYNPQSSRQRKAMEQRAAAKQAAKDAAPAAEGEGAPVVTVMSEKQMARAIASACLYIGVWQPTADPVTQGKLGELLALLQASKK